MRSLLNHPVWNALHTDHQHLAVTGYGDTCFYNPDFTPFGAYSNPNLSYDVLGSHSKLVNSFFVVGKEPVNLPTYLKIEKVVVCDQMVLETNLLDIEYSHDIKELSFDDYPALQELISLALPGYFRARTPELGDYYGIFDEGRLVACSGERQRVTGHIEVSGVATHPDFLGHNLATQVIHQTTEGILNKGKIPYLHVMSTNIRAIDVYKKIGYEYRCNINFWLISKNTG